jgi:RNA polymerase sigma factor (sigma-70 family)
MANVTAQPFTDHMHALFGVGTCAGLTDGQLLERFLAGRDEGGELAFEALIAHHGPMVMRVCRNALNDPQDVHDAFQAVFVVLARRANAIRHRESVASWLYGVAVRVSARARAAAIRRQIHDRRVNAAAQSIATADADRHVTSPVERIDEAAFVHHELSRLPEKYRAPVILCYLEGLTHDEAAAHLCWPVGTVRSRLARARDRLRARLSRRGMSAPMAVAPSVRWIAGDHPTGIASVASMSSEPIARELVSSIVRNASQLPLRRLTAAVAGSPASELLAQGVLKMMLIKKLLMFACTVTPILMAIGGGGYLVRRSHAQTHKPPTAALPPLQQATTKAVQPADDIDRLAHRLLAAARQRQDAQRAYYEEGRITIDRFVDANKQLALAELRLAKTDADRLAIRQRHVDRIRKILDREQTEMLAGRGTFADVSEAAERYSEAELDLKLNQREAGEMAAFTRRLNDLERKVDQLLKERPGK